MVLRLLPGPAPHRCAPARQARLGTARRPADEPCPPGPGGRDDLCAGGPARRVAARRRPAAAHRGALLRPVRPQRAAAAAPDRVRAQPRLAQRRPDPGAFCRHLPPPAVAAVLPRLGAGTAGGRARSAGRRFVLRHRRLADRRGHPADARARPDVRRGQAALRRPADAPGAQCRRPGQPAQRLPGPACAGRAVRRPLDALVGGRAQPPRPCAGRQAQHQRAAGRRRGAGQHAVGPPARHPPAHRAAGPQGLRILAARRQGVAGGDVPGAAVPGSRIRLGPRARSCRRPGRTEPPRPSRPPGLDQLDRQAEARPARRGRLAAGARTGHEGLAAPQGPRPAAAARAAAGNPTFIGAVVA